MRRHCSFQVLCAGSLAGLLLGPVAASGFLASSVRAGHARYLTLYAGALSGVGSANGTGAAARFNNPSGITSDSSGNIYLADSTNNTIRKITPGGVTTTFVGTPGPGALVNGTGAAARFYLPTALVLDSSDNLYVADTFNNVIREVTPAGVVTTFAGSGTAGSANGTGTGASFYGPNGLAIDSSGNIYVADSSNNMIRKITSAGVVSTYAGATTSGSVDGTGTAARFSGPSAVATDSSGNVWVGDTNNNTIRKITTSQVVTTIAGTAGSQGTTNATGTAARFYGPEGLIADSLGNLFISDTGNEMIRKMVISSAVVSTFAGSGVAGYQNGTGTAAQFWTPIGLGIDSSNNIYVDDLSNNEVRVITSSGVVTTLAGSPTDSVDGTGAAAMFWQPQGIAAGSDGSIYVAETGSNLIRKIAPGAVVTTMAGTKRVTGNANGTGTAASFYTPTTTAVDASGNVYVADQSNNIIRKITSANVVTTFAGSGGFGSTNGTGTAATFRNPIGVAYDSSSGNLYVADTGSSLIRKITSAGVVTTLAGSGTNASVDGTGTAAEFSTPVAVATDASGNLYVVDNGTNLIRKVTPAGVVTTIAGSGSAGSANGIGTAASFNNPVGIAVSSAGWIYVADKGNHAVRKIDPNMLTVTTVVGAASTPDIILAPLPAGLFAPTGVAAFGGMLYVVTGNSILRSPAP